VYKWDKKEHVLQDQSMNATATPTSNMSNEKGRVIENELPFEHALVARSSRFTFPAPFLALLEQQEDRRLAA
jgi:hypothetical protein